MRKILTSISAVLIILSMLIIHTGADSVKYSNPSAAYKGTVYHNSLLSVNLTGDERNDVIAVALSQLYYAEGNSEKEFHGLNSSGDGNFTEYCYNYGALDQDGNGTREFGYPWCAAFVTFCLRRAEISKTVAPSHVNCTSWLNIFKQKSSNYKYYARGTYTPIKGDIIFFKSASTSRASDHVGLVIGVANGYIYTVEGNTSGGVYIKSYAASDTYIVGFAVPNYKSEITSSSLSGKYIVTARDSLNMREGGGTSYNVITTLKRDTVVEVISFSGSWAKVNASGKEGWVSVSYIAPIECSQVELTVNKGQKDEYTVYAGYNCSVNIAPESRSGMEFTGFSYGESMTDGKAVTFTSDAALIPVFKELSEDSTTPPVTYAPDSSSPDSESSGEVTSAPSGDNSTENSDGGCASLVSAGGLSVIFIISFAAITVGRRRNRAVK